MSPHPYDAVILAGGRAERLGGGDKPLRPIREKPILQWIIERIQHQIGQLALNANGDPERFAAFGLPVLVDHSPDLGPMAGIIASMAWAKQINPLASHVLIVSGDTPFLPSDLVKRLVKAQETLSDAVVSASSAGRVHPTVALWPIEAADRIRQTLNEGQGRRVEGWLAILKSVSVEWDIQPFDPFFNVNTPEDLAKAEETAVLLAGTIG